MSVKSKVMVCTIKYNASLCLLLSTTCNPDNIVFNVEFDSIRLNSKALFDFRETITNSTLRIHKK